MNWLEWYGAVKVASIITIKSVLPTKTYDNKNSDILICSNTWTIRYRDERFEDAELIIHENNGR